MGAAGQDAWIILRTAGRSTLPLAATLAVDGFDVWTPAVTLGPPRKRVEAPIVPTYVFAKARHLWTLVSLSEDPTHRHEGFSVFRHYDRYPLIEDRELEPLRYEERKGAPPECRRVFLPGEEVRVACGPGTGKKGIVEYARGKFAMVDFGGSMRVKINAFILQPIMANSGSTGNGAAAQAA
jgi:hypothetical protein